MGKKNVDKINLKILFYEMVLNSQIFFFVTSYASVPSLKMQKFVKIRKKMSNHGNIKMSDENRLRNSIDWVKKPIQLLDMIGQQILIVRLKMIKQGQNKISRALI